MAKEEAERALAEFAVVEETERKIPDSLRQLLHDLICDQFECKPSVAAGGLRASLKRAIEKRDFRINPKALGNWSFLHVVKGRQQISYSQMDAMAQRFGIPMGLMLLFTRARSDVAKKRRTEEALRVLRATRCALDDLEDRLQAGTGEDISNANEILSHDVFKTFCSAYIDKYHETLLL